MSAHPHSLVNPVVLPETSAPLSSRMTMMEVIEALLLKNRTIASSDFETCLNLIGAQIPLNLHRFPTGSEYGTWVIPPCWNVTKALLMDGEKVLASYADQPLFLAPYSSSFTGWVSREELLAHTRSKPETPEAYSYEFRLAYDFRKRLKDWAITLPHRVVQKLDQPKYFVDIQVEVSPGAMLVGESFLAGQEETTLTFLAHLCHSGQANDGLAGVAVGMEVVRRIRKEFPKTRLSYQFLVMPETIGSAVYLASREERIRSYLGAVFLEMVGIRSPLRLAHSRTGNSYVDRVFLYVLGQRGVPFTECAFMDSWGNDERIFDSPGVGIPTVSLERYPFRWYHTSQENLDETDPASLEEVVEILMDVVRILESDFIPCPRYKVPVYLTRYDLYSDWEKERAQYDANASILELFFSECSVFDIAQKLKLPYAKVKEYALRFVQHGLVESSPIGPGYSRRNSE